MLFEQTARYTRLTATAAMMGLTFLGACRDDAPTQVVVPPPPPPPAAVARVEVTPGTLSLTEGDAVVIAARALDSAGQVLSGRRITWASADPSIAEVDSTGRLIAKRAGSLTITASVEGRVAEVTVTVSRIGVGSIAVSPTGFVLEVGRSRQLTAVVSDAAGNRLTGRSVFWLAEQPEIATVDINGLVTAYSPGYASIRATSEGKTFTVVLTVTNGEADAMPYDLVYHRTTTQALGEIMVLGTSEGAQPFRVNAGNVSRQPAPSPDGSRIAFYVSQRDLIEGQIDDLWAVDRNGMNIKRLTNAPGVDDQASWSPSGSRIAYRHIDPATGRPDIWVMNADGTAKVNLTAQLAAGESAGNPEWSPGGARIAFASLRPGFAGYVSAIWVMNADGTGLRQVAASPAAGDRNPTWSPDGSTIAFIRPYGNETDINLVSAAGGTVTRLALPGRQEGPAWSPDGRHFAFWMPVGIMAATEIYTVRADGTNMRIHTSVAGWGGGYSPRWIARQN